jgi:hypothetical protein
LAIDVDLSEHDPRMVIDHTEQIPRSSVEVASAVQGLAVHPRSPPTLGRV